VKIYTKKGDDGTTSLIGGTRVPKHHVRVEAYGTIDELNVCIGLVADQEIDSIHKELLRKIQDRLFTIGSALAADPEASKMVLPEVNPGDISDLEEAIDRMDEQLPPMRNFVLPGGHTTVSFTHLARVTCRRAERFITYLNESEPVEELILQYLNRLSDYLFVLSRKLSAELDVPEVPWRPRK
jgi:cob(I)alamin adenosyltransferase